MSRHNIISSSKDSSERRRSSASGGERWAYSVEAVVLLWAGSAAVGACTCGEGRCNGGGVGVAGVAVRKPRGFHPWGDWGGRLVRYGLIVPGGILESK